MQDLAKDSAQHYNKAKKFYASVAAELVSHGHTLDIFACALDQVGSGPLVVVMLLLHWCTGAHAVLNWVLIGDCCMSARRGEGASTWWA